MPSWLPENNTSSPGDDELRSLEKWCQLLFDTVGSRNSPYPEGLAPVPGDDEQRLLEKINILENG